MKKFDFFKFLVVVFSMFCLLLTFFMIPLSFFHGNIIQIVINIYLYACTIFFIFFTIFKYNKKHVLVVLVIEYFLILIYPYYEPHNILLEFIWIPQILFALAVFIPHIISIFLILLLGIPGSIFLSYGYNHGIKLIIGDISYDFHILAFPFYFIIAFLIDVLCLYFIISQNKEKYIKSLEVFNEHLNKINRSISNKIFRLENDTTIEERKRISKEVHDTAGYVFINLIMMLQAASAVFHKDTPKAESLIIDVRNYAERGINEIRHILRDIRDYSPPRISIQNEIFNIGIAFNKTTDVKVNIDYGNWPFTFSENIDSFFLSFMQESLTNALKHGHASSVSVSCWKNDFYYAMSVRDNGIGANLPIKRVLVLPPWRI